MGFLFKLILFTLLFCFVVYVLKMVARLSQRVRATITDVRTLREVMNTVTGARPTASAEMVRCASCGAFVATKEAVVVAARQSKQSYCSRECMLAHAARP